MKRKQSRQSCGIGGQAVMEGIMMKNKNQYAVAVRKPDQAIAVEKREFQSICKIEKLGEIPLVRGVIQFVDSLVLGMRSLTFSASFFEEGGDEEKESDMSSSGFAMGATVAVSILLAAGIFMVLPYFLSLGFQQFISSPTLIIVIEGLLRLGIFLLYVALISRLEDIRRVFMFHGAEHKCINCIESGLELNPKNVMISSKEHKRCGTSFLFFVIIVSILATMFIRVDSVLLRLVIRLLILPVVAGISYEIIRFAGNSSNPFVNALSKPGLWVQGLTTKEPSEDMIEVAIASVEAVFDWREYQLVREEAVIHPEEAV